MLRPVVYEQINASKQFHAIFGRYKIHEGGAAVPYFTTTMTLQEAADSLRIAPEIMGDQLTGWTIEELYQRQVNWNRVEHSILPYLQSRALPQFFSSITVALMPIIDGQKVNDLEDERFIAPELERSDQFDSEGILNAGPFTFGYYAPFEGPDSMGAQLGQLRWNNNQVFAVSIDGQHRLAAIRRLVDSAPHGATFLNTTRVPVVLIPLIPQLGYEPWDNRVEITPLLRKLFIDLNKHAVIPSRARLILLDDTDVQSLCVRQMIGQQLTTGFIELQEDRPLRIPLCLVDWHSEQAKFDDGPYVTTVLGVDWIVGKLLALRPVRDWADAVEIDKRQLRPLRNSLQVSFSETLRDRIEQTRASQQRPFSFPQEDLDRITERFGLIWAPAIVHILTSLAPYQDLISLRRENELDNQEFAQWYSLLDRADGRGTEADTELARYESLLESQEPNPFNVQRWKDSDIPSLVTSKNRAGLPFAVVFQKAIFLGFSAFRRLDLEELESEDEYDFEEEDSEEELDETEEELEIPTNGDEESEYDASEDEELYAAAQRYVESLNSLLEVENFFSKDCTIEDEETGAERKLWLEAVIKQDDAIDFTEGAAKRAADWIALATHFYFLARTDPEEYSEYSFDDLLVELEDEDDLTPLERNCLKLCEKLQKPKQAPSRIAQARINIEGRDESELEELVENEFTVRAEFLWNLALEAQE